MIRSYLVVAANKRRYLCVCEPCEATSVVSHLCWSWLFQSLGLPILLSTQISYTVLIMAFESNCLKSVTKRLFGCGGSFVQEMKIFCDFVLKLCLVDKVIE